MMHGQNQCLEQTPHLAPAVTAVILVGVVLAAFGSYARSLEYRAITALAADEVMIQVGSNLSLLKNQGTALQQAALETGCLLPIYGSSELNLHPPYNRPFHPTNLFHDYPTGFTIFPVGKAETTCLIILQKLAAVGAALEGRKVAVSVSPFWFFERLTARPEGYAGNFSALHAGELAFNLRSSLQLRQDAARRMLQYPATVANRLLLKFALESLADGSPLNLACYDAALPLGILHNAILRYQDHWSVVSYLWSHPERPHPRFRRAAASSWIGRDCTGRPPNHTRLIATTTSLGWITERGTANCARNCLRRNTGSDKAFLRALESNQEWVDLELLLRELTEFGAQPLLLSMPIHGGWYDQCGITYTARRAYYQRLREIGARYHAPVVDFADHDADQTFCKDNIGHLAPNGWVYYGQVLDGFFHDSIPRQTELKKP